MARRPPWQLGCHRQPEQPQWLRFGRPRFSVRPRTAAYGSGRL